jgi:filamentous hemagglutinin family protein
MAGPGGGVVRAGAVTIESTGTTTTITQTSGRSVIDWRSFSIAAGETVRFVQPGAQSAVLNRVTGAEFSSLQGTLEANGQVYLVNPNGILIGAGGRINAASLVATTASIASDAFMRDPASVNGRFVFNEVSSAAATGTIVNRGSISVADGGLVALVAPAVHNAGSIVARLGTIELASASHFTLDLFGDNLLRFALDDSLSSALTDKEGNRMDAQVGAGGTLTADGGRIVLMSVPAATGVVDQAINLSGVVQARSAAPGRPGVIELLANDGRIDISGSADVSAPGAAALAGSLTALGKELRLTGTARVEASGAGGGGNVVLGGRYTAIGATDTQLTQVDAGASVRACGSTACSGATGTGAGGTVRLYSTQGTRLSGEVNVSGSATGAAGTVEVLSNSGLTALTATGRILALTGAGQPAGFAAVLGNTLAIDAAATIDMRNVQGDLIDGRARIISDSNPASTQRLYVRDDGIAQRQTSQAILFHAYSNSGYENTLPAPFDPIANPGGRLFATGIETPVGTLRPNGGAPSSLSAGAADTLTAIPVSFTPSAAGDGETSSGSDALLPQANGAARTSLRRERAAQVGGPGVGRSADLGRTGDAAGAGFDVFGANVHVLAPANDGSDAQVKDYLCTTPYARNGCAAPGQDATHVVEPRDSLSAGDVTRILAAPIGVTTKTRSIRKVPVEDPASSGKFALRIQFERDSAAIPQQARAQLDAVAVGIIALPGVPRIQVRGHTDSSGAQAYNEELSARRADAVRRYLVERGVDTRFLDAGCRQSRAGRRCGSGGRHESPRRISKNHSMKSAFRGRGILGFLVLIAGAAARTCLAQVVIPPGLEPGQIQQQLRQLRVPAASTETGLPGAPEQIAPPATDTLRFVLKDVKIEGATVYTPQQLQAAFASLLGREISVSQVFDVANQLTSRYRRDGYLLSQVLVPTQSIIDGRVRLVAVEGYLDAVEYRGDVAMNTQLEGYSVALRRARPLTARVLERYLLLMNDLGRTTAYGTLVPAASAGAATLVVDFVRHRQHQVIEAGNRNSRSLGPWRLSTEIEFAGALSSWDVLALRLGRTADNELAYVNLAYRGPFGGEGLQWSVGVTGVRARPGTAANLAATDLKTESVSALAQLTYPLIRSRQVNLQARGALTVFDGQSELSLGTLSDDRLRVMRAGLSLDLTDRLRGITLLDVEFSRGLPGLGARQQGTADSPLSRFNGRVKFSKATVYAARLQSLGGGWSVLLAVSAQQAFTTLLAPELFAFGGEQFGRGYDAAELAGDSGESAKLELRYFTSQRQWGSFTPYAFIDAGRVRRRDPVNELAREKATSVGAGLRWTGGGGRWSGFLELADPVDHPVAAQGNRDARLFAGLRIDL